MISRLSLAFTISAAMMFSQSVKLGQVSVRADSQIVEASVLLLKGSVEITTENVAIQADEATFNVNTGDIEARGNLRLAKTGMPVRTMSPGVTLLKVNIHKRGVILKFSMPNITDQAK